MVKTWIAKDEDGKLNMFFGVKPYKHICMTAPGYWWKRYTFASVEIEESDLPEGINPSWEDEEPVEVTFKIEKINE